MKKKKKIYTYHTTTVCTFACSRCGESINIAINPRVKNKEKYFCAHCPDEKMILVNYKISAEEKRTMPGKVKSKAQARLLGAIAGGKKTGAKGISKEEAKEMLKGEKLKKLPKKAKKKKGDKK